MQVKGIMFGLMAMLAMLMGAQQPLIASNPEKEILQKVQHKKSSSSSSSETCDKNEKEKKSCKEKYLKEVCRIVYEDSTDIVVDAFNTPILSKYDVTSWFNLIFENDLGLADRITNIYTPQQFDRRNEFVVNGVIFTKAEYLDYVAVLYKLWSKFNATPYGPCSGCDIFYSYKYPNNRFLISSTTNGTVIIDGNKLEQVKGQITYNEAVAQGVVIKFIPSTWNTWHEYIQVDNYIYHTQEDMAASNGLQIIDMNDPFNPFVIKGDNLTFVDNNHRWHDRYPGNFQGAHFPQKENYRPFVWINGTTPLDAWKQEFKFLFPTNFECEPIPGQERTEQTANATKKSVNFKHPLSAHDRDASHPYGRIVFGYDVCQPTNPTIIANWHRVYAHDAKVLKKGCKYYLVMSAIFNESVYFIDITDPYNVNPIEKILFFCLPKLQGAPNLTGAVDGFECIPHSVYFSECGKFMYLFNENFDLNLYVFDIQDIQSMRIIDEYRIPRFGSIMHEARREFIPSRGIDRLVVSAYDAGGLILDIKKNPAKPELLGWNQSAIQKFEGAIIQPNLLEDGFWSLVAMGQDDYSFGAIIGGGNGGVPTPATVLLQLRGSNPDCKKSKNVYSKCEMLEAIALNDVFGSNDVKLDYLSRVKWFGCKDGCHKGRYKGSCKIPKSYKVDCCYCK